MNNRILLLGATGRTGSLAVQYALDRGYSVTALVRNPDRINIQSDRLTVIKGLPTEIKDVRQAMKNCDCVISLLSALSEKESMSFRKIIPPHTLETSIRNIVICMEEIGIQRILSLSSIGVGDSFRYAPWYMKLFIRISNFKIVFADHHKQEQLLKKSDLDWTIVRPVALNNNEESGTLIIQYDRTPKPFTMSRKQLAKFMIDNIPTTEFIRKAPILSENSYGAEIMRFPNGFISKRRF